MHRTCAEQEIAECPGIVQVWEQEVAWTEADKPIKRAARALTLPDSHKLNKAPIFCFETMMHMLYWSCLVYDYKRVRYLQAGCLLSQSHHSVLDRQRSWSSSCVALSAKLLVCWLQEHVIDLICSFVSLSLS